MGLVRPVWVLALRQPAAPCRRALPSTDAHQAFLLWHLRDGGSRIQPLPRHHDCLHHPSLFSDIERPWCHTKKSTTTGDVDNDKKEQHQENEPAVTVHEDASARVTVDADKINVVVAVPGVRSKDLNVRVIDDHMLRITGETKKGNDVFRVAKDIALPNVDVETMSAKHEDGMLSIVVKRKIHQVNIPIASAVEVTSTPAMNEE